ncbi:MAG: hypothetical protein OXK80_05730 [Bdellovibrionales bacterium]|nr:hypothetical protein [Bdellovibrionales bacterium]
MAIDVNQFSEILRNYISEKQKINPTLSENQIANKIGISASTFHRMINCKAYPHFKTIIKLCETIPELKTFITYNITEVSDESKTSEYIGEELEDLMEDQNLFITYALAISHHGITEDEITYCIGYNGQKALRVLLDKGFVKKEGDRYRATNQKKGIVLSFKVLKKHIVTLAERYKPDCKGNNYIFYKTESLNKAGIKELKKINKETHRKVQRLMEKEEYKGDTPMFSVGFCDMFCIKKLNKGENS